MMLHGLLIFAALAANLLAFDAERALDLARQLSDDRFEGRKPGHAGGKLAEEYVADYCRGIGLDPVGTDGYFQAVPLLVTEEQAASFAVTGSELGKITFTHGLDFNLITHSGSGYFTKDIVVAGYGIVSPAKGRDDYQDLDVNGKVVVIVRGAPTSAYSFDDENTRTHTLKEAKARGAAAVLWYADAMPLNGAAIREELYDPELPLMYVGERVLQVVLENSGYSIASYKEALKTRSVPLTTDKQAALNVKVRPLKDRVGRNVCAMLYGNDAVLRNEIIVVGAHLDHCGINAGRIPYNGADDNASGSGLIGELARALKDGGPYKRSVMFIWFTAEEDGLLGSYHFVEQPTIPFGNIAAMFNFDMVGQGDGNATVVGLELLGGLGNAYADSLATLAKAPRIRAYRGRGSSDYAPFAEAGAPAIAFYSSGDHPFYHHFSDDGAWLNPESFAAVGTQAEALIRNVAMQQTAIACRSDSLRVLSRFAVTLDVDGFFVDQTGTVSASDAITVAWLPYDARTTTSDMLNRSALLHTYCADKMIASDGLKKAIEQRGKLDQAVVLAITEAALFKRTQADIVALARMGLSLVHLTPGADADKTALTEQAAKALRDAGSFALIPLDFKTGARVNAWGSHAIVTATLDQFAQSPAEVRDSLLTSPALVLLDVISEPTAEQLETLRNARQRYVHLNFGESYPELRESEHKAALRRLYEIGFTRDDILCLFGANLRRFLNG
ncbi:MAG: M28 family peptidase [bacterium]|nr:M28 family peptidase [bacterium]